MRLSEKKRQDLYEAVAVEITEARIKLSKMGATCAMDDALFRCQLAVWKNIKRVLNIKEDDDG